MDRLVYSQATGEVIERVVDCGDSVTYTSFDVLEAAPEQIDAKIEELNTIKAALDGGREE
jgi:hypothetical protein